MFLMKLLLKLLSFNSKEQLSKTFTYLDVLAMPENLETVVKEEGKEYKQALFNNGQWIFKVKTFGRFTTK